MNKLQSFVVKFKRNCIGSCAKTREIITKLN